jgi:RNA-directed DNA polymerase
MEELYVEGLASHDDPESCAGAREGAGEALTGARAGGAIEPRNHRSGVPTPSPWRKATLLAALCEASAGPARSKNHGMCGTSRRENREIPRLARPAGRRAGRPGNAEAVRPG